MVKDVNGQILRDGVEVRRRCPKYFVLVLNVADVGGIYQCSLVDNWQMGRFE